MTGAFTVSDASRAYLKAWEQLPLTYPDAKFIAHLSSLRLVNYHNGIFTFEAPSQEVVDLFTRRADKLAVQHAIEVNTPPDLVVHVEFILAWSAAS